jgi:hypothetical protein
VGGRFGKEASVYSKRRITRKTVVRALGLRPTVAFRNHMQRGKLLPWGHPAGFWVPQPKSPVCVASLFLDTASVSSRAPTGAVRCHVAPYWCGEVS